MISLSRRWPLLLAIMAAIAVLAFAACGDDDEGGGDGDGETHQAGERIQGGDLIAQQIEFDSIDPHYSAFAQDISTQRMMWRALYTLNPENVPEPEMAADDPEITNDGKTFTIPLREGLLWSDGDDLTAEDFVAGIVRTCNPLHAGQYQYLLTAVVGCDDYYYSLAGPDETPGTDDDLDASTIDAAAMEAAIGAKAIDPTTIEFTLTDPQPTFQMILSLWFTFPSPVHLLPNSSDEWPDGLDPSKMAFNGPYQLVEYKPQDFIKLAPNPNWDPEDGIKPTLDSLTMKFIDDSAVSNNAYRNNELHFALADQAVLPAVVSEFGDEYLKLIQPATRGLEMQLTDPTLANLEVRLALAQAIDREQLVAVATNGAHLATTSWFPEAIVGGMPPDSFEDVVGFDEASAQEHLANAGYPGGEGFPDNLSILVRSDPLPQAVAQFLQNSFKTVLNIDIQIENVDGQTRASRFSAQDFTLFHGGWIQDYPDPENWVLGQFDVPGVGTNKYNCDNQKIKDKVDEATFNQDQDARIKLYQEINEIIVTEVCGITPYYHEAQHYLIKPEVVGMRENSSALDASLAGDANAEAWGFSQ